MASPSKKKRPRIVDMGQIGNRVRELRDKQGLNQLQFAQVLGSAQGWLSELESGKHASMEVDTVIRLAQTLGVSTDYLLGLDDEPQTASRLRSHKKKRLST